MNKYPMVQFNFHWIMWHLLMKWRVPEEMIVCMPAHILSLVILWRKVFHDFQSALLLEVTK